MWSQCFEEAAHTCTGLCKNLCHSISQPVVEKMHFVLYGVGHLDAHPIQRIGFFSLFDGGKEQHTNAQPEVQCVDGLEGANAEILKPKALLFTAEILFNSPTGKVALHHLHHILFAGNGAIGHQGHRIFSTVNYEDCDLLAGGGKCTFRAYPKIKFDEQKSAYAKR